MNRRIVQVTLSVSAVAAVVVWLTWGRGRPDIVVGAKSFTESQVLADIAALLAREEVPAAESRNLGGTLVLWRALLSGEIDAYPEYTGTLRKEMFGGEDLSDDDALWARLAKEGVSATRMLGFNNSYALGMKEERAEQLGVVSVRDLARHPTLRYGFSNEFLKRDDGWPALRQEYGLEGDVLGLEHQLAYGAVEAGDLDVVDVYTTDPAIAVHGLRLLEDDFFPRYDAMLLYRADAAEKHPTVAARWKQLGGSIDEARMLAMNESVEVDERSELRVAADFVEEKFGVVQEVREPPLSERLLKTTRGHMRLVVFSLLAAIAVAVPGGVLAAKRPVLGQVIVTVAEVVQTIPGLALLVFLSAMLQAASLPSLGAPPVIAALFLYSLLPILRNTMSGLQNVPASLRESAAAPGLSPRDQLLRVELPLASRTILAGIKTTAVINVGYATLGGLIGAVCYGEPIMTGLRKQSTSLMLEGAIPAACMALLVKLLFEGIERAIVPAGLREDANVKR